MTDQWGTVSKSYRDDLKSSSPLAGVLNNFSKPFAFPNGIPIKQRLKRLRDVGGPNHLAAKEKLQQKYFNFEKLDDSIPVLSFVGRVVAQKGVHVILECAEDLINKHDQKICILVGGPANPKDPYAAKCANKMKDLS